MVDGKLVIKEGVCYDIMDDRNRKEVVKILSKNSAAKFKWARHYIRVRRVFLRDEEVLTDWKIIKLSQLLNTATYKERRETSFRDIVSSVINQLRT